MRPWLVLESTVKSEENDSKKPTSHFRLWLTLLVSLSTYLLTTGHPVTPNISLRTDVDAVVFLSKFGYLPQTDLASRELRNETQLRDAIRQMQRFAGIKETGELDEGTIALMKRRRCGMPDLIGSSERIKRYAIQGQKWSKNLLTWSINDWPEGANTSMIREQLAKAFHIWSEVSKLEFQEVQATDADIGISFFRGYHGDGYPFDGKGLVLAHAFFPGDGLGGDTHFDGEELWIRGQPSSDSEGVDLFSVAAHEFGHSLGLAHSSVIDSLMFPYYQPIGDDLRLPYDDAVGVQQLYGARKLPKWEPLPPGTIPTTQHTTTNLYETTTYVEDGSHLTPPPDDENLVPSTRPPRPLAPDACNSSIDALSIIRRELFIFKGKYFWRLNSKEMNNSDSSPPPPPLAIDRFWYNLPADLDRVDAVYVRPLDDKIVFFLGNRFWLFNANIPEPGYPRPLTDLGLPANLQHVDAALVWGHNGKTYLFTGQQYWRFDEVEGRVELDYPRSIIMWRGVPAGIDAALQWEDGKTYFFKDEYFWTFDDKRMKTDAQGPKLISSFWFGCSVQHQQTVLASNEETPTGQLSGGDVVGNGVPYIIERTSVFRCIFILMLCVAHTWMYTTLRQMKIPL
ncbi:matrix metalloproteinase-2-like [Limulus polyphemus]|uniref:Matrix metalloproteinase-2-like n=1 Tax=Limulus polyphemus TaxID=6850 RepID=A0ABM1B443_LIMPO|nr:matrix metalloproteinase-2-like [Limulus polyphemus]